MVWLWPWWSFYRALDAWMSTFSGAVPDALWRREKEGREGRERRTREGKGGEKEKEERDEWEKKAHTSVSTRY